MSTDTFPNLHHLGSSLAHISWWTIIFGHKPLWQSVSCCERLPFSCNSVPTVMSLSWSAPKSLEFLTTVSLHPITLKATTILTFFPHWRLVLPLLEFHTNGTTECVRVSIKVYCIRSHVLSSQVSGSHGSHNTWRFWLIHVSWVWRLLVTVWSPLGILKGQGPYAILITPWGNAWVVSHSFLYYSCS